MSDMRDTEPLLLDENRMRHVIEWAYEHSKDPAIVYRYLSCGAGLYCRREDDEVVFVLGFDNCARELADIRAEKWGSTPDEPTDTERETLLLVARVPYDVLTPRPQG
jgi:hypothetical protein